jgi:hypothetical protein
MAPALPQADAYAKLDGAITTHHHHQCTCITSEDIIGTTRQIHSIGFGRVISYRFSDTAMGRNISLRRCFADMSTIM